jgi:hypothetical protein
MSKFDHVATTSLFYITVPLFESLRDCHSLPVPRTNLWLAVKLAA